MEVAEVQAAQVGLRVAAGQTFARAAHLAPGLLYLYLLLCLLALRLLGPRERVGLGVADRCLQRLQRWGRGGGGRALDWR
jgi:hypothetical protein